MPVFKGTLHSLEFVLWEPNHLSGGVHLRAQEGQHCRGPSSFASSSGMPSRPHVPLRWHKLLPHTSGQL